jgi:hypothetical protein
LCYRVEWLLRHAWDNNIRLMAKELKVSHTALSRVLGGQMPSGKMLEALASRADINAQWLLAGPGDQMAKPGLAVGSALWPLATCLMPGEVGHYPELLTHLTLPAASPHLLEAAYWVQMDRAAPIVLASTARIARGDFMLLETSARWTRRPQAYLGRLLALRQPDGKGVILADTRTDEDEFEDVQQYTLNTFGLYEEARLFPGYNREDAQSAPPYSRMGGEAVVRFYGDDVAGVVLQVARFLERDWGKGR